MKQKTKALVLFSGGLDSRLVAKLLQQQGLEIELLYFKLPFGCGCCNSLECNFNFSQREGAKLTIFDCTKGKLFQEYLAVIKNPKYGRGVGLNPCIDCKIFMFRKAKKYADKTNKNSKNKIKIIATGEVLGERPMSQTSRALRIIDDEIGFELLRPLSAKLFEETEAEKAGIVDRGKLFAIQGRSRKEQIALAEKYKIQYPTPAGGCLLCDKNYTARLKDFLEHQKDRKIIPEHLLSLQGFRHFRSMNGKLILGKNHAENLALENLNKKMRWQILIPTEKPGPAAIYENHDDKNLAESLIRAYSSGNLEERKKFEKWRV